MKTHHMLMAVALIYAIVVEMLAWYDPAGTMFREAAVWAAGFELLGLGMILLVYAVGVSLAFFAAAAWINTLPDGSAVRSSALGCVAGAILCNYFYKAHFAFFLLNWLIAGGA